MKNPEYSQIIAFIQGELDESQQIEINGWLTADPENQRHFERVRDIWELHGKKAEQYQPQMEVAWQRIETAIEDKTPVWHWMYRIAAALVFMVGIGYFMINRQNDASTLSLIEHVANSDTQTFNLPDGSIITLKRGSKILLDENFDQPIRHIQLTGEAFFEVARDEERPFIIETNYSKTEVLGTSFSIVESAEATILNVVSGRVAFSSDREQIILTKGDRGTLSASGQLIKSSNTDLNFLSWKTGQLFFENASLETVLTALEKHYDVRFQFEGNDAIITTQFNNQSLEEVLAILSGTLEIDITAIDSTTYIVK